MKTTVPPFDGMELRASRASGCIHVFDSTKPDWWPSRCGSTRREDSDQVAELTLLDHLCGGCVRALRTQARKVCMNRRVSANDGVTLRAPVL